MCKFVTFVMLVFLAALAACSQTPGATPSLTEEVATPDDAEAAVATTIETAWRCPDGFAGQQLSIYNWATYIGSSTVRDFEILCDVQVIYDVYDSDEALIARMRQGNPGYDLGFPTDYATSVMIREGLLTELDKDLLPSFGNLSEVFIDLAFDPGNQYSVPYLWGTTGIGYNRTQVDGEITSWRQLFEYGGSIAWLEDSRRMIGLALLELGFDPNSTNPDEVEQAKQFLIANSSNVKIIAADDGDSLLVQGEVEMVIEYGGDMYQQILENGEDYVYIAPPGAILDITSVVILKDAPNSALAHAFIDYLLDPAVAAHIVDTVRYASPNQAAIDAGLISEEILSNSAISPDAEAQQTMWFVEDVGDAETLYNDAWDEIKVSIGQ